MRAGSGSAGTGDRVTGGELAELAPVEGEDDRAVVAHGEPQGLLGREHERPVEQHVRRHRREQEAAESRRDDGATRRERVRGGTGGRGDDHAVGGVRRERRAVHVDFESDEAAGVDLLEHSFVEREPAAARRARRLDLDREHHALGDLVVAREQAIERGVEVVGLDLGEVTELPDVHAEHGDAGFVRQVDGAEHRAVTAERDHDVEPFGELVELDREMREPGAVGVGSGHAHFDAVLGEEVGGALGELDRGRPERMRHEPDPARGHRRAPGCATASSTDGVERGVVHRARRFAGSARGTRRCRRRHAAGDTIASTGHDSMRGEPVANLARGRLGAPRGRAPLRPRRSGLRPASNCGFTSSTRSACDGAAAAQAPGPPRRGR